MTTGEYVFISYSSKNLKDVNKVVDMLEEAEIPYWKAPEMIPAGSNYAKEIPRAIKECKVFLLMISKESQESIWVEKEIDCAVNERRTIVPVNVSGVALNDMFRFYLNNVQTIYYGNDVDSALVLIKERILSILDVKPKKVSIEKEHEETFGKDTMRKSLQVARHGRFKTLELNAEPIACQYCNGNLKRVSRGVYRCLVCNQENYDYYQTIRNYLNKYGPKSAIEIEKETKIPRKIIVQFLREEMLEIPKSSSVRLTCRRCGMPIRTGIFCDFCKSTYAK